MSTTSSAANPPVAAHNRLGTTSQRPKPSSLSNSDWLGLSLLVARALTAAGENLLFPYVKGVFGTVVVLLEYIEKVEKNRDDLKQLCENIIEIMKIVQGHIDSHTDADTAQLEELCADLDG
ncbi:hypothetical protein B0H13DRAFT_2335343 [Mycena leptocephala]|nr:hypothetical protein B0H13DRAFT_2335343 [Mycena leptocephala]